MTFSLVDASQISAGPGPHPAASPFDKRITEHLGVRAFEVYKVELPPGARTEPHTHTDDHVEDVYAITRGSGWLLVDDKRIPVTVDNFIAVAEASTRHIEAGPEGCDLIAICA